MPSWQRAAMRVVLMLAAFTLGLSPVAFAEEQVLSLEGYGVGAVTAAGVCSSDYPSCQVCSGPACVVQMVSGTGLWQHVGTFTWDADFTIDQSTPIPTPSGFSCFKAYGESRHTMSNGDIIDMEVTVDLCTKGPGTDVTFDGAYNVTGGTGRFQDAAGFGSISGGLDANGKMLVNVNGTFVKNGFDE